MASRIPSKSTYPPHSLAVPARPHYATPQSGWADEGLLKIISNLRARQDRFERILEIFLELPPFAGQCDKDYDKQLKRAVELARRKDKSLAHLSEQNETLLKKIRELDILNSSRVNIAGLPITHSVVSAPMALTDSTTLPNNTSSSSKRLPTQVEESSVAATSAAAISPDLAHASGTPPIPLPPLSSDPIVPVPTAPAALSIDEPESPSEPPTSAPAAEPEANQHSQISLTSPSSPSPAPEASAPPSRDEL